MDNTEYTIDDAGCIWPEGGGCMAEGDIREAIRKGRAVLKDL